MRGAGRSHLEPTRARGTVPEICSQGSLHHPLLPVRGMICDLADARLVRWILDLVDIAGFIPSSRARNSRLYSQARRRLLRTTGLAPVAPCRSHAPRQAGRIIPVTVVFQGKLANLVESSVSVSPPPGPSPGCSGKVLRIADHKSHHRVTVHDAVFHPPRAVLKIKCSPS